MELARLERLEERALERRRVGAERHVNSLAWRTAAGHSARGVLRVPADVARALRSSGDVSVAEISRKQACKASAAAARAKARASPSAPGSAATADLIAWRYDVIAES